MDDDLLARAKADPEAFRWQTVNMLHGINYQTRAWSVAGKMSPQSIEEALRLPWIWSLSRRVDVWQQEATAKAHNDALLLALTEMSPAERERLGW
jgi:hypothetical protein